MGVFDHFPYTNFHELNLEWILLALKEIQQTMGDFVSLNAIKYADPIQWNITKQYEKNTIVIDPLTGTAYISVRPVPSGANITDTDYWTVVFDLGQFVTKMAHNLANVVEPVTTLTATVSSSYNDWIIWGDVLYRNINPSGIIAGDAYVIGSNIESFTIEDVVGHIEDLTTTDKTNLVAAINEVLTTLFNTTGDLDDLNTTDKTNLVAAINDVLVTLSNTTGDLDDLNTTDKTNLVAAINEVKEYHDNLRLVNVRDYGAVGDGVTDDYDAFHSFYVDVFQNGWTGFIPNGHYMISHSLNFNNESLTRVTVNGSILGESIEGVILDFTPVPLKPDQTVESHIRFDNVENFEIGNFTIKCCGYNNQLDGRGLYMRDDDDVYVHDIDIINCSYQGVQVYHHDYRNGYLCHNLHFKNVNIYGVENIELFPGSNWHLMPLGWVLADVENCLVENCHIENIRWYGYEFKNYCRNSWVRNCSAESCFTVCHIGGELNTGDTIGVVDCGFTDISAHNCQSIAHGANFSNMVFDNLTLYNDLSFVYSDVGDYALQAIRFSHAESCYVRCKLFNIKDGAMRIDNSGPSTDNVVIMEYVSLIDPSGGGANTAFARFDDAGDCVLYILSHPLSLKITDDARIQGIGNNMVYDKMNQIEMLPSSYTQRIATDSKTRDVYGVMNNYTPRIQVDYNYTIGEIRFRFTDDHNVTKDVILTESGITFPSP